jgi:Major Facilitator Superfamily
MRKIGPGPDGCGANSAILPSRPRQWARHSLRARRRLTGFSLATIPTEVVGTGPEEYQTVEAHRARGIYLAKPSGHGFHVDSGLLGSLGAVSFAAELIASIPFGIASHAISPRWLMVGRALIGAFAVQLFALGAHTGVFHLSRALAGTGVAAVTPPLLAHLADAASHDFIVRP